MPTSKIESRIALIEARVAKDQAELVELRGQLSAAALVNDVAQGWSVSFKVGRSDTRREVTGEVLGRGDVKGVDSVRVQVGSGLECELFTVKVADLTGISQPVKEPSEIAVALGNAAAGESEAPASEPEVKDPSDELLADLVG
ncbi:hypothetical protein FDH02_gp01 [Pseudomonas phage VSW-3]|uniref:Uncharacterized protein n=1 Tax=Pseudomonas phage VSW-3 TaxID=1852562 RepID=A0A173GCP2_9CAUD|nr:hypothetical protein FDH02_gp01 [Pseudomonas phage VSW-3]ANH51077.1 hypothetical protein VSW3_1 [Pseudomonas phage VSW-3]